MRDAAKTNHYASALAVSAKAIGLRLFRLSLFLPRQSKVFPYHGYMRHTIQFLLKDVKCHI